MLYNYHIELYRYIESITNSDTIIFSQPEYDNIRKVPIISMSTAITLNEFVYNYSLD